MKKFVALKSKIGVGYEVVATSFGRNIGESMKINNVNYTVIFLGTESDCIQAVNLEINELNKIRKEVKEKNTKNIITGLKELTKNF